MAAHDELARSS